MPLKLPSITLSDGVVKTGSRQRRYDILSSGVHRIGQGCDFVHVLGEGCEISLSDFSSEEVGLEIQVLVSSSSVLVTGTNVNVTLGSGVNAIFMLGPAGWFQHSTSGAGFALQSLDTIDAIGTDIEPGILLPPDSETTVDVELNSWISSGNEDGKIRCTASFFRKGSAIPVLRGPLYELELGSNSGGLPAWCAGTNLPSFSIVASGLNYFAKLNVHGKSGDVTHHSAQIGANSTTLNML